MKKCCIFFFALENKIIHYICYSNKMFSKQKLQTEALHENSDY